MQHLDLHERPPEQIRHVYKKYQKMKPAHLDTDEDLVTLTSLSHAALPDRVHVVRELDAEPDIVSVLTKVGLHIIPSLLPAQVQSALLSRLLHRDLSNPAHLTNIHAHYNITYPPAQSSFFALPRSSQDPVATPLDPNIHKPLTVAQLLDKKMRWTTLGHQYDWTAKTYPESRPPPFPVDIKTLLESIFTHTKAEAAIVNLYSPGDTLSVHRDVAEASSHGLVSVSLGCDAVFVVGTGDKVLSLRIQSGCAVYMSGPSRFAWHGVPQIVAGTCPPCLQDWPGGSLHESVDLDDWKGWMAGKRVNLNVRQMWD
ncbi:hypothetical protein BDU57DRAFT_460081 [Ampelomyces quisqualis]|uniref:mRNA N(6)-methyladenine demethylase n=1 Tax=Ampelomyces quisqualis TaxID=50730 RepID=A0A6A5QBW5_AMPQU|nr:hypothetical protein BDU57DRAFT_460081 [Ampelomyces quisqualis]